MYEECHTPSASRETCKFDGWCSVARETFPNLLIIKSLFPCQSKFALGKLTVVPVRYIVYKHVFDRLQPYIYLHVYNNRIVIVNIIIKHCSVNMMNLFNRSFRQNRCHKTYPLQNDISINWPLAYTLKPFGFVHIRIKRYYLLHPKLCNPRKECKVSVNDQ